MMVIKYLNIAQAAEYLRYEVQSLYDYTSRRMIPFLKAGRHDLFRISELDLWLNSGADYDAAKTIVISRKNRIDEGNINMNVDEVGQYLDLAASTIYNFKCTDRIPYIKMRKKLLFRTTEIDRWLDFGGNYETAVMIMAERATVGAVV